MTATSLRIARPSVSAVFCGTNCAVQTDWPSELRIAPTRRGALRECGRSHSQPEALIKITPSLPTKRRANLPSTATPFRRRTAVPKQEKCAEENREHHHGEDDPRGPVAGHDGLALCNIRHVTPPICDKSKGQFSKYRCRYSPADELPTP
jgi:hypothetical protein